jgi:hypothetical protein
LLVRWREGVPLAPILPGNSVVQELQCPVETLRDVSFQVATYGRRNSSTVEFSLFADAVPRAQNTVLAASLSDAGWGRVALAEPLRHCRGRNLEVRITSPDAAPGNSVTIWSYPPYYGGRLAQAHTHVPNRVLGLEMNVASYGLDQ